MQVHEIKRAHALKKRKVVARGGKRGKTAGRGGKGQTARAGNKRRPALRDIIKKLPKLRGHGKNRAKSTFYRGPKAVVNVRALDAFKDGDIVTPKSLLEKKLIPSTFDKMPIVKILGTGEITVKVTVEGCAVSKTAEEKIKKAGGSVVAAKEVVVEKAKKQEKANEVKA